MDKIALHPDKSSADNNNQKISLGTMSPLMLHPNRR
jgi:hypothetical protein